MNIRPYIILNGVNSQSIQGLLISELAPISKPQVRTQVETIDGRSGDIVTPLGYAAYDKEIKIGLTRNYDIDEVIEFFNTSGTVIFSNEPTKYYRYAIYEQIDFERLLRYRTAEITFHVQPFKFSTTEATIIKNGSGAGISANVVNSGNIYSRPELLLTGSGNATVDLNSSEILSVDLDSANGAIFIDSENMNAYGANSAINNVIAYINAYQDGEGDPSPSNERTIHGFTELNIIDTPDSNLTELKTIDNTFNGVVNFNQIWGNYNAVDAYFAAITQNNVNDYTLTTQLQSTSSNAWRYGFRSIFNGFSLHQSHRYLCVMTLNADFNTIVRCVLGGESFIGNLIANTDSIITAVVTCGDASSLYNFIEITFTDMCSSAIGSTVRIKNAQLFDLTQMFGSTIADYIYSLEQAHAGDGVAFFRNLYPNDYYDYDAGTRELMPLTEKTVYTVDISENPQDPDNPQVVYGGYYESKTGLLNITYGIVDLGSLSYTSYIYGGVQGFYSAGLQQLAAHFANSLCSIYKRAISDSDFNNNHTDFEFYINEESLLKIKNSNYTDAAAFKTAMNGVQLVYELAEPIQIQLAPTQINNLIGLNQVFTDTNGDVAVDYRASGEAHFEQAPIVSFTCTFEDIIKGTLLNRAVTGNYDNIKLNIGLNNIVVNGSGVKQFAIDKYSRWL